MKLGVFTVPVESSMDPAALASAAEQRGFDGVWFPDHTHFPVDSSPYLFGGEVPVEAKQQFDPLISLAAAAAATSDIALGTAVLLVAQRDPIVTAKQISTLDQLSGGRVKVGIGFGWNRPEVAAHGVDPALRWSVGRERVLAMKALWSEEVASFDGEHFRLAPSWQWPKPVQRPHPPIYLGGALTPSTLRRIVDYCDGWIPVGVDDLKTAIAQLHEVASLRGRDPRSIDVIPLLGGVDPHDDNAFNQVTEAGLQHAIVALPSADSTETIALLDRFAVRLDP